MDFNFSQKDFTYSPQRFFNRELSLLKFHQRVLSESFKASVPLLERLRFLSISGSNLDEFCMVRFAGLKNKLLNNETISIDGKSFKEQIKLSHQAIKTIKRQQFRAFNKLRTELSEHNFHLKTTKELNKKELKKLEQIFINEIAPQLLVSRSSLIPHLSHLSLNVLFKEGKTYSVISIPKKVSRFITISKTKNKVIFVSIEEAIILFKDKIFNNKTTKFQAVFSIIRSTLVSFDNQPSDIIPWFERALQKRTYGQVVMLEIRSDSESSSLEFLKNLFKIDSYSLLSSDFLFYRDLQQIIFSFKNSFLFKKYIPRASEQVKAFNNDSFKAIEAEDILIHHPYESYDIVVNFLKQAAIDPSVITIKQTIYRTNKESPIMYALMDAAKNGKDVTAFIELRARFDEQANIGWAKVLESHGVKVIFGHPDYKFHSKISLISRQKEDKIKSYVHYGTGNYNPITANIYTDLSFFSCDDELCSDADKVFEFLRTRTTPQGFKKLVISPFDLRSKLLELIEQEISFALKGKPATIWAKANSLMDDVLIDALYKASNAGVKIVLIIRGICSLRPNIKDLSENITVKSIVGRFLEHSRIYCFGNGKKMSANHAKIFISSADLMRRNMVKRIETLVPIIKPQLKKQILNQILYANIKDSFNSWELDKNMRYNKLSINTKNFNAQEFFMKNASLSATSYLNDSNKRKAKNTK